MSGRFTEEFDSEPFEEGVEKLIEGINDGVGVADADGVKVRVGVEVGVDVGSNPSRFWNAAKLAILNPPAASNLPPIQKVSLVNKTLFTVLFAKASQLVASPVEASISAALALVSAPTKLKSPAIKTD